MTDLVSAHRDGGVVSVTLNRPQKKNALTGEMYEALLAAFETASDDEGVGALLLSGEGGVFTAGNDIGDFLASAQSAAKESASTPASRFIRALARFEKPLVAAIEGQAVGIGTTLCFHCDLVYAAPSARFLMPFVNLGLVPEAGSSMLAPMRFGRARAAEFLLLAEPFDAITLDRMLPGRDGLEVVRALRAAGSETPVLMVSAPPVALTILMSTASSARDEKE